jgi:hypothetical protein
MRFIVLDSPWNVGTAATSESDPSRGLRPDLSRRYPAPQGKPAFVNNQFQVIDPNLSWSPIGVTVKACLNEKGTLSGP